MDDNNNRDDDRPVAKPFNSNVLVRALNNFLTHVNKTIYVNYYVKSLKTKYKFVTMYL